MVRRSRATVVLATLAAVLVANLEPCGAQALQDDGPPKECIPECTKDGRWGIPCAGWCEWYVECKDGLPSTPIKCGTSWFIQTYFDNTKHECRLSVPWNSVNCDWWMPVTTAAPPITPPPNTSSSSATTTTQSTAPTTTPSTAPTTTPSTAPTTSSDITETTSIASITSPLTIIPTSNPPSNSSESTTPSSSESTTPSSSESTTPGSSETTTPSSRESTTPSSSESTVSRSSESTPPPTPRPGSADRASAAVSVLILAVGLVLL